MTRIEASSLDNHQDKNLEAYGSISQVSLYPPTAAVLRYLEINDDVKFINELIQKRAESKQSLHQSIIRSLLIFHSKLDNEDAKRSSPP